jgi:hypothetical protein
MMLAVMSRQRNILEKLIILCAYVIGSAFIFLAFILSANQGLKTLYSIGFLPVLEKTAAVSFLFGVVLLTIGYLYLSYTFTNSKSIKFVVILFTLSCALYFLLPPFLSPDHTIYYRQAWLFCIKGLNPYKTMALGHPDAPGAGWIPPRVFELVPYGPLWVLLASLIYILSSGHLMIGILLFKLLMLFSYLIILVLLSRILRYLGSDGKLQSMIYFGAHPLVLLESLGMSHNDLVAIALIFIGIYTQMKWMDQKWIALLFSLVATLFKVTAIISALIFWFWLFQSSGRKTECLKITFKIGLGFLLIFLLSSIPFISEWQDLLFPLGKNLLNVPFEIRFSPVIMIRNLLYMASEAANLDISYNLINGVVSLFFIFICFFVIIILCLKAKSFEQHLRLLGICYFILTLSQAYWRAWYVLWPVSFAALAPTNRWSKIIAIYGLLAIGTNIVTRSNGIYFFG